MQSQRRVWTELMAAVAAVPLIAASGTQGARVDVRPDESARRVDVTIDSRPFTSYIYPASLKKPVLFPVRTAAGVLVTRGFPLDPRPGERVDHPHHVGLWFNHGDVNGLDFWNNSDGIAEDRAGKMGTIVHRGVVRAAGGADRGELVVDADWNAPDGTILLGERTRFVFRGAGGVRSIDRITTLTARDRPVTFRDSKEGTLGLRVARELEQPADKPEVYLDAAGKPSSVPVLNNTGVTGKYRSSEGLEGDAVWGTRGRWMLLGGSVEKRPVGVAMLDHPSNPGFPSYWHARGYGLFAVNPLGRRSYDPAQPELTLRLEPAESVTFRHRVLVFDGPPAAADLERAYREFASRADH